MSVRVQWAKRAQKEFLCLDRTTQARILAAIDELAEGHRGAVRRFEGSKTEAFRLRVGGWRIIFSYLDDGTLLVLRIRPRGEVYKR